MRQGGSGLKLDLARLPAQTTQATVRQARVKLLARLVIVKNGPSELARV